MRELLCLLLYMNVGLVFASAVADKEDLTRYFWTNVVFWPVVAASLVAAFDVLLVSYIVRIIRDRMNEPADGMEV